MSRSLRERKPIIYNLDELELHQHGYEAARGKSKGKRRYCIARYHAEAFCSE